MSGFWFMGFNAIFNNISVRLNVHPAYEYTFDKIITIMGIYNHFNIVLLWTMYLGLWCLTSLSVLLVEETGESRENHRPVAKIS